MLGIFLGREDCRGRMKRGLGGLSGSTQIDLFDVFATLSETIDIFNRLSDDKQRILVGNAAIERLDSSVNILDDEFITPLGRASLKAAFLMSSFATASLASRMQSTSKA